MIFVFILIALGVGLTFWYISMIYHITKLRTELYEMLDEELED